MRSVRGQISGTRPESFVLEGEDWFELSDPATLAWPKSHETVEAEQSRLATVVGDIAASRLMPSLGEAERLALVLGVTCHAVYHAGRQVQLIKRLR